MKYAILQIAGRQFKVEEGDVFQTDVLAEPVVSSVLMYNENGDIRLGNPYVEGIDVEITKVGESVTQKIRVARFKSKSRYRRTKSNKKTLQNFKVVYLGIKRVAKPKDSAETQKTATPVETKAVAVTPKRDSNIKTENTTPKEAVSETNGQALQSTTTPKVQSRVAKIQDKPTKVKSKVVTPKIVKKVVKDNKYKK